jgi:CheY-like chemotaxis protein
MPQGGQMSISTDLEKPAVAAAGSGLPGGAQVRLTVTDTGCGIAPEDLPHIFEPFFTTKGAGKGTGLGLAIVHGMVQQHQGRITVASETGRGTTFQIYFPAMPGPPLELPAAPKPTPLPQGTETLLVVEDEDMVRLAVTKMLQRFGYAILQAGSGEEALQIWRRNQGRIQLVLTDIVMPGMTGFELARQLQSEQPALTIIYTSGYIGDLADQGVTLTEGVNFLPKPYEPRKLAAILRDNLAPGRGGD